MGSDLDSIGVVLRHGGGGLLHGENPQLQLHGYNDVALDDKVRDLGVIGAMAKLIELSKTVATFIGQKIFFPHVIVFLFILMEDMFIDLYIVALRSSVDIKHWRVKTKNIATVFVEGKFVTSGSFDQKEISKLNDAKGALHKLSQSIPINQNRIYTRSVKEVAKTNLKLP
ncbi:hypothetical protein QYF36_020327 [Acer negundo]|nr:hypothetical protein QYF36_020327 [Acer negundo]